MRRRPHCVLLLDEVEKAHPDVFHTLLQLLDDGRLTDGKGRTVDFTQALVLMTSNLQNEVAVREHFRPEFLNRLDDVVAFHSLDESAMEPIVKIQLGALRKQLALNGIELDVTDAAVGFLAREGYDPVYGARPLKRAIQKHVVDRLARETLEGTFGAGDRVQVDAAGDDLTVRKVGEAQTAA